MKEKFQNIIDSLHLFFEIGLEQRHLMKKKMEQRHLTKKKEFWLDTSFVWNLGFVAGVFGFVFARLVDHWYPFLIASLPGVVLTLFDDMKTRPRPKPAREAYAEYLARQQEKKRQRDSSRNPEK